MSRQKKQKTAVPGQMRNVIAPFKLDFSASVAVYHFEVTLHTMLDEEDGNVVQSEQNQILFAQNSFEKESDQSQRD